MRSPPRERTGPRARLRMHPARRPDRGRSLGRCRRTRRAGARPHSAGPPRGDSLRRRTDRDHPRQRPRRAQPGICAGARKPSRRRQRASRRWPPTPTAPTAAPAAPTTRPGPMWTPDTVARARAAGLDPAAFLRNNDSTTFFAALGGPRHDRADVHKCQRFPCDTCRQGLDSHSTAFGPRMPARPAATIAAARSARSRNSLTTPDDTQDRDPLRRMISRTDSRSFARRAGRWLCRRIGRAGRRRFPAVQQHREPRRRRRSATRTTTAGPPKAGGTSPRAAAKRCCAARWWRGSITSMPSTMTAAANGRARPSCARATRNSPCAAPKIASRAASTAPDFSRSTPANSNPGPCSSPKPANSRGRCGLISRCCRSRQQASSSSRRPPIPGTGSARAMRRQRRTKIVATLGPASSDAGHDREIVRRRRGRVSHQHEPHHAGPDARARRRYPLRRDSAMTGRSASWSICRDRSCASANSRATSVTLKQGRDVRARQRSDAGRRNARLPAASGNSCGA